MESKLGDEVDDKKNNFDKYDEENQQQEISKISYDYRPTRCGHFE